MTDFDRFLSYIDIFPAETVNWCGGKWYRVQVFEVVSYRVMKQTNQLQGES